MWSLTFGEWSIRGVWVVERPDVLMWPQPGNVVSVNAGKLMRREILVLDNLGLFSFRPSDSPSMSEDPHTSYLFWILVFFPSFSPKKTWIVLSQVEFTSNNEDRKKNERTKFFNFFQQAFPSFHQNWVSVNTVGVMSVSGRREWTRVDDIRLQLAVPSLAGNTDPSCPGWGGKRVPERGIKKRLAARSVRGKEEEFTFKEMISQHKVGVFGVRNFVKTCVSLQAR